MQLRVPSAEEIAYQRRHADDDRRVVLFVSTGVMTAAATIAVILRLISRRLNKTKFQADDHAILVALVLAYGLFANGVVATRYGLGRHAAVVGVEKVHRHFLTQYTFELVYLQAITVIKVSILLFYRRLFDTDRFRKVSWVVGGIVLAYWIAFTFAAIFQCTPVDRLWVRHIEGTCIDTPVLFLAASVLNIVINIVIVVLPFPIIWALRVSRQQKIALTGLLLLGSFVCLASIVRTPYLLDITSGGDPTWYSTNAAIWTIVEVSLGIVCACLPVMRPLFVNRRRSAMNRSTVQPSPTMSWPPLSNQHGPKDTRVASPYPMYTISPAAGMTWTTITAERTSNAMDDRDRIAWAREKP